jgi:hypothetical protein
MVPVPAVTRCSAASPSRPIRSWTWPGRRPGGLATVTSAPSTSCSGCSPRATAGPPSSFGRLGWSWRRCFGVQAVGEATWRVTRRRWWWGPRVVWTPLCGPPLVAKRALQLASQQAHALGHGEVRPEHLLLGVLEDARQPTDKPKSSRRHRQVIAHLGLPDGYHGAGGPLPAGLEIDLGRLRAAVAAELKGIQR